MTPTAGARFVAMMAPLFVTTICAAMVACSGGSSAFHGDGPRAPDAAPDVGGVDAGADTIADTDAVIDTDAALDTATLDAAADVTTEATVTCDTPLPALPSCSSVVGCAQPVTDLAVDEVLLFCIAGTGLTPRKQPCGTTHVSGRCFDARDNRWMISYGNATAEATCRQAGRLWCPRLPGLSAATADVCRANCATALGGRLTVPECSDTDALCYDDCVRHVRGMGDDTCTACLATITSWPRSGCGTFECSCASPAFATPTGCATACAP